MDQVKIGKFIAARRRAAELTQMQLAEKLGITDRAVSKWETGNAMPDSSIMLTLCGILGITVNDLLSGEVVSVDNYSKEMEERLLDIIKEKENSDKRLLKMEWVICGLSLVVLFVPIIIGALLPIEEWKQLLIVFAGFIPAIIGFSFAIRIEQVAGYYECQHCHNRYVPRFGATVLATHVGRTRYLKCPECKKRSWSKKVISKEDEE